MSPRQTICLDMKLVEDLISLANKGCNLMNSYSLLASVSTSELTLAPAD